MALSPEDMLSTPLGYATPAQIKQMRDLANSISQSDQQQKLYKPWQGIFTLGDAALVAYNNAKANQLEQQALEAQARRRQEGAQLSSFAPQQSPSGAQPVQGGQSSSAAGQIDRSRFAQELQDPNLRNHIMAVSAGENLDPKANLAVMESMMNRAHMMGTNLAQESRLASNGGYYAGYNPRALNDPQTRAMIEGNLKSALGGSNVSNYATDNSSGDFAARRAASGMYAPVASHGGETFSIPNRGDARGFGRYADWRRSVSTPPQPQRTAQASTGTATDAAPAGPPTQNVTIAPGENLDILARRYGVPVEQIMQANGLTSPRVPPNTTVRIPSASNTPSALPNGPQSFAQSTVNALTGPPPQNGGGQPGAVSPLAQAQARALTGQAPPALPGPPQAPQAVPGAPGGASDAGPFTPRYGTFIKPEFLPPRTHMTGPQIQAILADQWMPQEAKEQLFQQYLQQQQPIQFQHPAGMGIASPQHPENQALYPTIEKGTIEPAPGMKLPYDRVTTPEGYRVIPTVGPAGQTAAPSSAGGTGGAAATPFPTSGDVGEMAAWGRQNSASAEAMKKAGEKAGEIEADIGQKAEAALQIKSTAGEMRNLVQNFKPGVLAAAKEWVGNFATSMGVPQDEVNKVLGRTGDIEAFKKNTAFLAIEAVKQISNRATQMEFQRFLENNPNIFMTPQGMQRVIDRIEKLADQSLDKQKEWTAWKGSHAPHQWGDFNTHWNQQEAKRIEEGKLNSEIETRTSGGGPALQRDPLGLFNGR